MTRLSARCCVLLAISSAGSSTALADPNVSLSDVSVTLGFSGIVGADYDLGGANEHIPLISVLRSPLIGNKHDTNWRSLIRQRANRIAERRKR
jgi:methylglyoxal synthase